MHNLCLTDSQAIALKQLLESLFDLSKEENDLKPEIEQIYLKLCLPSLKNSTMPSG
jgi:hypothetical protein